MTIDVGTGDGRAILAAAAREPSTLAIGLDPDAASMAEASSRAARSIRRGGLPNALFVVAAAEAMPPELVAIAHLVTVRFPWASLLRGVLGRDEVVARGVASLMAPDGTLELLVAPATRDRLDDLPTTPGAIAAAAAAAFEPSGRAMVEARPASTDEIRASGSTWAKRLFGGASRSGRAPDRTVTFVRLRSAAR